MSDIETTTRKSVLTNRWFMLTLGVLLGATTVFMILFSINVHQEKQREWDALPTEVRAFIYCEKFQVQAGHVWTIEQGGYDCAVEMRDRPLREFTWKYTLVGRTYGWDHP